MVWSVLEAAERRSRDYTKVRSFYNKETATIDEIAVAMIMDFHTAEVELTKSC